jgi:hypothetical protein
LRCWIKVLTAKLDRHLYETTPTLKERMLPSFKRFLMNLRNHLFILSWLKLFGETYEEPAKVTWVFLTLLSMLRYVSAIFTF